MAGSINLKVPPLLARFNTLIKFKKTQPNISTKKPTRIILFATNGQTST